VGILHAIERQQQGRGVALQRREKRILVPGRQRADVGRDPLVHRIPEEAFQGGGIDTLDAPLVALGELLDVAHARVVAPFGEAYQMHTLGMALEHDAHRVQTVDGFGGLQA
jgi:hypothetical protein